MVSSQSSTQSTFLSVFTETIMCIKVFEHYLTCLHALRRLSFLGPLTPAPVLSVIHNAQFFILQNDNNLSSMCTVVEVQFTQASYTVSEAVGFLEVCIQASGGQLAPSTVSVSTSDFTAMGKLLQIPVTLHLY